MKVVDFDKLCEMFWDGNFMEIHKDDIPSIPSAFEGMTNGEVIKAVFPNMIIVEDTEHDCLSISNDFWNADYKGVE